MGLGDIIGYIANGGLFKPDSNRKNSERLEVPAQSWPEPEKPETYNDVHGNTRYEEDRNCDSG